MIPDVEKLTSNYLRDKGFRVVGRTPENRDTSWVRLTMLDAGNDPALTPDHLIRYLLQADCYAGKDGGQPEANTLGRSVRAALHEMPEGSFDGAVVTAVRFAGMARIPDTDFTPARERIALTAIVYAHPVEVAA